MFSTGGCWCSSFVSSREGSLLVREGGRGVPAPGPGIYYIFKQCSGVLTDKARLISPGKRFSLSLPASSVITPTMSQASQGSFMGRFML